MTKQFQTRIEKNDEVIAKMRETIADIEALHFKYRNKEITWDEFCAVAYKGHTDAEGRAKDIIYDLKKWNALLNGETVYFNGSYHTDVHPYEVVEILSASKVLVREMKATIAKDAEPYDNRWDIESNPKGKTLVVNIRLTARGLNIHPEGDKHYDMSMSDEPHYYYDYSF